MDVHSIRFIALRSAASIGTDLTQTSADNYVHLNLLANVWQPSCTCTCDWDMINLLVFLSKCLLIGLNACCLTTQDSPSLFLRITTRIQLLPVTSVSLSIFVGSSQASISLEKFSASLSNSSELEITGGAICCCFCMDRQRGL